MWTSRLDRCLGCFLLIVGLVAGVGPAFGAPQTVRVGCKRCKNLGVLPCKQHSEELLALEKGVQFCSVAARCEDCGGSFWSDCDRCDGGTQSEEVAARRKQVAEWLANEPVQEYLGRPVPLIESKHFLLILDTGPLKEGRKKIDNHTCLHRVVRDVEQVADMLDGHLGLGGKGPVKNLNDGPTLEGSVPESEYFAKMRMWMWDDPKDHGRVMRDFLHSSSDGDFKLLGRNPIFSFWTEPDFSTLPEVRRLFTHNASHMLISNLFRELWFGDTTGGWFDAGAGHWYEYAIHGMSTNYCIEEGTVRRDYHNGQWRAPIRKRLEKEDGLFLPELIEKDTGHMELPEQALCWSFYDWIVAAHPEALRPMLLALKQETPSRTILEENLGGRLPEIEARWRAWVSETYPLKGDTPRESKAKK
ncbi:MAG: hypothetical protein KDB61_05435 [Planctomycetes bacterium]|nr:hypothetical protein [Planctomycetota bacterium]